MREYQQKYIFRKMVYSKTTIVVLFLLIVLLTRSIMELRAKNEEISKLKDDSAKEREIVESKVKKAEERNKEFSTPRGFESYVRTTYPVVKEGEGVIVVYDEKTSPVVSVREETSLREKIILLWQKITGNKQ